MGRKRCRRHPAKGHGLDKLRLLHWPYGMWSPAHPLSEINTLAFIPFIVLMKMIKQDVLYSMQHPSFSQSNPPAKAALETMYCTKFGLN